MAHTVQPSGRSRWRFTLGETFLPILLLMTTLALVAQPSPVPLMASVVHAPKIYVGLFKDNAVAVLDSGTRRVLSTIPVPPGPHGLVVTPDGRKAYVSSDGASTVSVIDTATDRVVRSIEVGPIPHGLAVSPDGRLILVSVFGANQAVIIDTAKDEIVGRVPVPQAHNSAISPDGRMAYVGSQQQGAVALVIIDLVRAIRIGSVPLDAAPRALNFGPGGKRLYFTSAGVDAVRVLDPASNQIVAQIPVGASPHHPLLTSDGQYGLVVSQGPGELDIIDPMNNAVAATVKVGKTPHWIAVSSDARVAYVTNEGSNDVSVIDLVSRTVTATIPVGNAPRKIAMQPGPTPTAAASDQGTTDVQGQTMLVMRVNDYLFTPPVLRGRPGQKVRLEIENESATLHNISIPGQQLDTDIPPKRRVAVDVTFPHTGVLRFFCKFHSALGMQGELRAAETAL
jgi:YVTN family beta-propeller protein